jgi:hypothetical protein
VKAAWAAFTALVALAAGLLMATFLDMVRDEIRTRLGRLPGTLVSLAVRRLPPGLREDLGEEWRSELEAITETASGVPVTGLATALWFAVGVLIRGPAIARAFSGTERPARSALIGKYCSRLSRLAGRFLRKLAGSWNPGPSAGIPSVSADGSLTLKKSAVAAAGMALAIAITTQAALTPGPARIPGSTGQPATQIPASQAAGSLAALIAQSATDRSQVVSAVDDVASCGPDLRKDSGLFRAAAASRQELIGELNALPGRPALPGPMVSDLTRAWQVAVNADNDYAAWAHDESASRCTPNDISDPAYQAAALPDDEAATDKHAFMELWNPVAAKYHLAAYQWDQL